MSHNTNSQVMPELNTQGLQGERTNNNQPAVQQHHHTYNSNQFHNSGPMYFQQDQQQQYFPSQNNHHRGDYYQPCGRARGYQDQPHRGSRGRANRRGAYVNYQGNRGSRINNQFVNQDVIGQQQQTTTQGIQERGPGSSIQNNDDPQNYWEASEYLTYGQYDRQSYDHGSQYLQDEGEYFREDYDDRSQRSYHTQYPMHYDRGSNHRGNYHRSGRGRGRGERGNRGGFSEINNFKIPVVRPISNAHYIDQMNQENLIQQNNPHYFRGQERGMIQQPQIKNISSQDKPKYTVHRRQYGTNNSGSNKNKFVGGPNVPVNDDIQISHGGTQQVSSNKNSYKRLREEHKSYREAESTQTSEQTQHKIVQRVGGRGRGQFSHQNQGAVRSRGQDDFQYEASQKNYNYPGEYQNELVNYGPKSNLTQSNWNTEQDSSSVLARFDDDDIFEQDDLQNSELMKYGDYGDEEGYQQMEKHVKNTPNIKYRLKTFDDDIDSDISLDDNNSNPDRSNNRRGPKLIKFKQKKPSERLALSQIKSELSQQNQNYDAFVPQNQQKIQQIQILKPYMQGFDQPKFYQGPQWKFVRQSTNQNSKQKHYEKGDYDRIQFNFPGAEQEDKETDGETKLYPPIDDYSDEDVGIAPSSNVHRAKISFNKTKAQIDNEKLKNSGAIVNVLPSAFDQGQSVPKIEKKKCPPSIQAKTFTFDQKKTDKVLNMESAENFFIKQPEELIQEKEKKTSFFEQYVTDKTIIDEKLKSGQYFKGVIRMNPKFRYRAYVSIQELNIDILVEGYKLMNRSMDGDQVLIEMMPVHQWIEMSDQNTLNAKITTLCQTTGEVQFGINHLKKDGVDDQAYTNEASIENRTVDNQDRLSLSCSQSEDDQKIKKKVNTKEHENILNKFKPKKISKTFQVEGEGYFASSENNIENRKEIKKKSNLRKESQEYQQQENKQKDQLSQSNNSTDQEVEINIPKNNNIKLKENDDKDLWENLEENLQPNSVLFEKRENKNRAIDQSQKGMSIARFLGQVSSPESDSVEVPQTEKLSSFLRKELKGTRDQIINQINEYGKTIRPLAKVIGLTVSLSRNEEQMVTLIEIEKDTSHKKLTVGSKPETIVFAVPVNDKLPWFITSSTPDEFESDKKKERNPRHRYYVAKFQDWMVSQRRPHCNVIESIGEAGNLQAETMRILKMHGICTEKYENEKDEPTSNVHECLKPFANKVDSENKEWIIPSVEIAKRLDLRNKRIFTIDPITAKDLDDALSIEKITDTIYEIGVHIADVSYFVQQGSDLDKEALKRSTSTYFVHKVFPMLPRLLCERLCSLNPNVDRLTYSIFYRMDLSTGEIDKTFVPKIERSVINSCVKWNYELAQNIIDGKIESKDQVTEQFRPKGEHSFLDIAQDILIMNKVAQARRKMRFEAGSIEFVNREFNFTLNKESMYPVSWKESPKMQSKQLVEEYMLLANILVAEFIAERCKDKALLRVHNEIKDGSKEQLGSFFNKLGLNIDVSNALGLSKSLQQLKNERNSEDKLIVVNRKFLTNLQQAKYITIGLNDEEDLIHYGLNFNLYTHFTSPIRRYADLLVHRLLTISLKEKEHTREKLDGLDYSEYAEEISEKSYSARKASKDCVALFHCLLLKEHGQRVYESLIFNIENDKIGIYIDELNMHFNIKLRDDPRIDQTTFFENDLSIVMSFRNPQALAAGLKGYFGAEQLKISNTQRKKELEMKRIADDRQDLVRRLMTQNDTKEVDLEKINQELKDQSVDNNLKTNCILHVFDKIKVKIWASDSFPMEIRCHLLITESDLLDYSTILEIQTQKLEQLRKFSELEDQKTGYINDQPTGEAF